jgi:hypothetical protein
MVRVRSTRIKAVKRPEVGRRVNGAATKRNDKTDADDGGGGGGG